MSLGRRHNAAASCERAELWVQTNTTRGAVRSVDSLIGSRAVRTAVR
jgi:hypothetical protein